jgi:hypothetical protein
VAEASVGEQAASIGEVLVLDENPDLRQEADPNLGHMVVEDEVRDVGTVEQSIEGRDQHGIMGANKFAQERLLSESPAFAPRAGRSAAPVPRAAMTPPRRQARLRIFVVR